MHRLSRRGLGRVVALGFLLAPVGVHAESPDELRAACVAEVRKGGAPIRSPSSACARYEGMTQGAATVDVDPAPRVKPEKAKPKPRKQRSSKSRAAKAESGSEVEHDDGCGKFDYGSIAYRHCRADEKKRLTLQCRQLTAKADRADGKKRAGLKASAARQCQAARQYQIVD